MGGFTFVGLNAALESNGGYLRKASTLIAHVKKNKRRRMQTLIEKLSRVDILRALPPEEVHHIVPSMEDRSFKAGDTIFRQGDPGSSLYIIDKGRVSVHGAAVGGGEATITELGPGETFGEMALLWNDPRSATVEALEDTMLWEIHSEDFDDLLSAIPPLRQAVTKLAENRKAGLKDAGVMPVQQWKNTAIKNMHEEDVRPSSVEMEAAMQKQGGNAALSMWLGIFLDGIPESLVIGASMIGKAVSPALLGGLFFANLPEAMSSGTMMKNQGHSTAKIFMMWMSLCVITGLGALIGNLTFHSIPHTTHAIVEGLAAGAMLAMIAQTMLPEAYEHGGWMVGILTVFGFLSALMFRALAVYM
jgi:zinc transporter ZupT